jgi:hypothetical protein
MAELRVAGPVVRLWVWTDRGPFCRLVLREELPVIQAELAVEGAIGWWVTECTSE